MHGLVTAKLQAYHEAYTSDNSGKDGKSNLGKNTRPEKDKA
ncbi:hypothetical protein [Sporotomaculum syntrophicum]|nr:hypothetical protein [Sporotomaculum syntrophicum]